MGMPLPWWGPSMLHIIQVQAVKEDSILGIQWLTSLWYCKFLEPKLSRLSKIARALSSSNMVKSVLSSWIALNFSTHLQIIAKPPTPACEFHPMASINITHPLEGFLQLLEQLPRVDGCALQCTSSTLNSGYLKMFEGAWSLLCEWQPGPNSGPWFQSCWACWPTLHHATFRCHLHAAQILAIAPWHWICCCWGTGILNICFNKLRCTFWFDTGS